MEEIFVKKYWEEEDILFYIHFQDGMATRQVEFSGGTKILLSVDEPTKNESKLYDQSLEDLEISNQDFISQNEFEEIWRSEYKW